MAKEIILKGKYYTENLTSGGVYKPELFEYTYEDLHLNIDETVYLVVDVYGEGYDEGDPIPTRPALITKGMFLREKEVIHKKIRPAIDAARNVGLTVIYVENSFLPNLAEEKGEFGKWCRRHHGYDFQDEFDPQGTTARYSKIIEPLPTDYVVQKRAYDGFYNSQLDYLLRNLGIKNLICVGFAANICLFFTMYGGFVRNYKIILIRDCTLAVEYPETEEELLETKWAIRYVERWMGYSINAKDFVEACKKVA